MAVSYATGAFENYQRLWARTATRAGFDEVLALGPSAIDATFADRHRDILGQPRGAGYWLWKPHIVARALATVADGDLVVYSDAATHYVGDVDLAVDLMDRHGLDLLLFGEGFVEREYTKRDVFVLLDCDEPEYTGTPQRFASCFAVRRRPWTTVLVDRYLECCTDARILTDIPNTQGLPDHPGFVDHRHDQSVLSLLSKQTRIPVPSNRLVVDGLGPPAGQLLNHTRVHHSPGAVLHRLLGWGILGLDDARALSTTE